MGRGWDGQWGPGLCAASKLSLSILSPAASRHTTALAEATSGVRVNSSSPPLPLRILHVICLWPCSDWVDGVEWSGPFYF